MNPRKRHDLINLFLLKFMEKQWGRCRRMEADELKKDFKGAERWMVQNTLKLSMK